MNNDISSLLFGKPISALTLQYVQGFFKGAPSESNMMEFKSFPRSVAGGSGKAKEEERKVLKAICAFLNSEGGVLVWGAPEEISNNGGESRSFKPELAMVSTFYEREDIIGKITNRIVPSPNGILFHRLEDKGNYLYLLEVPPSEYAPHQFEDVYYMRMDGMTKAAPHHYIEALFRKVSFPNLEAYLKIENYQFEDTEKHSRLTCTVYFRNMSRYQNDFDLHCQIETEYGKVVNPGGSFLHSDSQIARGSVIFFNNIAEVVQYGRYRYHSFEIIYSRDFLRQNDFKAPVSVIFGANLSPLKICDYVIKLGPVAPLKGRSGIVTMKENQFYHENLKVNGRTDQDVLDFYLTS